MFINWHFVVISKYSWLWESFGKNLWCYTCFSQSIDDVAEVCRWTLSKWLWICMQIFDYVFNCYKDYFYCTYKRFITVHFILTKPITVKRTIKIISLWGRILNMFVYINCNFHNRIWYFWKMLVWLLWTKGTKLPISLRIKSSAVCSYHVTYAFQSGFTLYSWLNAMELLAWNRRKIWSLSVILWT